MSKHDLNPKPGELVNLLLVGGPYAGLKTRVPYGMRILNINDGSEIAIAHAMREARADATRSLPKKGTLYSIERCTVASPTLNDTVTFWIGLTPGTKMSDAFMEVIAGYCMMCRPDDYLNDETPVATLPGPKPKEDDK